MLNAKAFTSGQSIVFGKGYYKPDSVEGRWLIAHELTHFIQQNKGEHKNVVQAVGEPPISAAHHQNISDAITLFQNSSTFTNYSDSRFPSLCSEVLNILNTLHPGEIGYRRLRSRTVGHSFPRPGDMPEHYEIEVNINYQSDVNRTALNLVHEAVHHVLNRRHTYIYQEYGARNLQLDFYLELKNSPTTPLSPIPNYESQLNARNRNQLIDWIIRVDTYGSELYGRWVRENRNKWGGLTNRREYTKARYIQELMEDSSDRRWNTELVISILDTVSGIGNMNSLMRLVGGGITKRRGYRRLRRGLRQLGYVGRLPYSTDMLRLQSRFPDLEVVE
jgi:hypothetical protein